MASSDSRLVDVVVRSRAPSLSPAKGSEEISASLSSKLGDLILTYKEASGLVINKVGADHIPRPKWAAVGKVLSTRKLVIGALERAMQRAWGLHRAAQFRDIGDNRFVVRFGSEGDWNHAVHNGPWQFDFSAVLMEDYDGKVRPSDMNFDRMAIWIRVFDLPLDMMNKVYGKLIGNWVGKYLSVDVDDEGLAWGEELRIRVEIQINKPLIRGVNLKESDEDKEGKWFNIKYEKIPHFCFECGMLFHFEGGCQAVKEEVQQWGEWLRASPGRNRKPVPRHRPSVSQASGSSKSVDSEALSGVRREGVIRDLPPKRSLFRDQADSGSSHTGGREQRGKEKETASPVKPPRAHGSEKVKDLAAQARKPKVGTYVRRSRTGINQAQPPTGESRAAEF
jgi:hypothetical protein